MKIFISPAKKMRTDTDFLLPRNLPLFLSDTYILLDELKSKSREELQKLFGAGDEITELNYKRFRNMNLEKGLTPAILSYEGIQYQYMAPQVFERDYFEYIEKHLRILSGFYGILRPFDGVTPYRLEMQTRLKVGKYKNLYEFWGQKLSDNIIANENILINLASKEYSKAIVPYLHSEIRCIECIFGEEINGIIKEKGVYVKMARGEMVRYLAENNITNPEDIKYFNVSGYNFRNELSTENKFYFVKGGNI